MPETIDLGLERLGHARVAVTDRDREDPAEEVEVALAVDVGQVEAVAALERNRLLVVELTSEDEIIHFARQYSETLYHPTSTCKMGSDPNGVEMAVVDEQLQVYGIGNLRVADASIMPIIVRGNTNAPSMMIAEKAAAMILETTERKKMQVEA